MITDRQPTVPEELLSIVRALEIAAHNGFMSHVHAASIWKKILSVSGFDVANINIKNKTNGTTEKNK